MVDLYPATRCTVCGGAHDLCYTSHATPPAGTAYAYDCPAAVAAVFFRPGRAPVPVDAAPAGAVLLRWVAN